jgi:2-polyprenyl-3-methyl-5-hydroxy-6-metoxy-1,4-benzoquinol methylase
MDVVRVSLIHWRVKEGRTVNVHQGRYRDREEAQAAQRAYYNDVMPTQTEGRFRAGALQELYLDRRVAIARRFAPAHARWLDLGCGDGVITARLADFAEAVVGVDISDRNIAVANELRTRPNVRYVRAAVEEPEAYADGRPFDAVSAFEILEHVYDPGAFLRDAAAQLRPGGVLILSTPNAASLTRRLKRRFRPLVRRAGYADAETLIEEHHREYTLPDLRRLVRDAGLRIIKEDGVVLLLPFPNTLEGITQWRPIHALNVRSGGLRPSLAAECYLAARKER